MSIPSNSDWPRSTVGEQFHIQLGKRFDAAVNRGIPKPCLSNRGVRWGRIKSSEIFVGPLTGVDIATLRLKYGDVLVCEGGEVGRASVWRDELRECYFQNTLHRLRPIAGYDPRILVSFLQLWASTGELLALVGKSSLAHLTKENLMRVPIPVPPKAEQLAIATALDSANDLVGTLERLIAKKQAIKQGMMQQLLTGKTRLPGYSTDWRSSRLSKLLSYEQPNRFLVRTDRYHEGGSVPVLTAGKTFVLGYTNETEGIYLEHPVIIFDDFTTASKFVNFNFKVKSSAMKILRALPGNDIRYVYERMQLIDFPLGDHKRYWISEYSGLELEVPPPDEQRAIAAVLSDANAEIAALRRRLEKAKAIKQGMMQELLTGRTRLPAKEEAAA